MRLSWHLEARGGLDSAVRLRTRQVPPVAAPMPPTARARDPRPVRAAARQAIGSLKRRQVAPRTFNRYTAAVAAFLTWLTSFGQHHATDDDELEAQLCAYIEHLWQEGEGRARAGDTLSGAQFFLNRRRAWGASWRLFSTWGRLEVPNRAPPFTAEMLMAFAGVALHMQRLDYVVLLSLGFHAMLRTEEVLSVRTFQFTLSVGEVGVFVLP